MGMSRLLAGMNGARLAIISRTHAAGGPAGTTLWTTRHDGAYSGPRGRRPAGSVWTFQLRRNVKFHDGTPLDAPAVVWNIERWWKSGHPQHENQVKAGQTFEYWEGQFGGFDDKSIVSKVEAVGSHAVRITLKAPQAPFLANLAMFVFDIASPRAVEKWGTESGKHPVGTGAFKFVEWKPNQEVVLEANPDYWGVKPKVK